MLKSGLVTLLVLIAGANYAQPNFFVLIQSENSQPFYLRTGERTFVSSPHGYLVLSQLKEGNYPVSIGFPGHTLAEQQFTFNIAAKDLDFQLKDQEDKGWVLLNAQTRESILPEKREDLTASVRPEGVKKDDPFSRLMAGVVSDTVVMYNNYAAIPSAAGADPSALSVAHITLSASPDSGLVRTDSSLAAVLRDTASTAASSQGVMTDTARMTIAGTADREVPAAMATGPVDSAKRGAESRAMTTGPAGLGVGADTAKATVGGPGGSSAAPASVTSATAGVSSGVPAPGMQVGVDSTRADSPATALRKPGEVVRINERISTKAVRLVYADREEGQKTDTIIVIIPLDSALRAKHPMGRVGVVGGQQVVSGAPAASDSLKRSVAVADTPVSSKGGVTGAPKGVSAPGGGTVPGGSSVPSGGGGQATTVAAVNPAPLYRSKPDSGQRKAPAKVQVVNSDCKNFASDYDVDRLRVKMLEAVKDEDRIQAARKAFKMKCFSSKQIRALSEVFTSDALRYRFFETAYPFVSDDRFYELSNLLADPAYNSKFRIMTGH